MAKMDLLPAPFTYAEAKEAQSVVAITETGTFDFGPKTGYADYNPGGIIEVARHPGDKPVRAVPVRRENQQGIPEAETVYFELDANNQPVRRLTRPGRFPLREDPRNRLINGELWMWGVRAKWPPHVTHENFTDWDLDHPQDFRTVYCRGSSLATLTEVGESSSRTKGIVLGDEEFYGRPQSGVGNGTVSWRRIEAPQDVIDPRIFNSAQPVGEGVYWGDNTYGGFGDFYKYAPDINFLLTHIATSPGGVDSQGRPNDPRRIYETSFAAHHLPSGLVVHLGGSAVRGLWKPGPAKNPTRAEVVYQGGMSDLTVSNKGLLEGDFTVGLSDAQAGWGRFTTTERIEDIAKAIREMAGGLIAGSVVKVESLPVDQN